MKNKHLNNRAIIEVATLVFFIIVTIVSFVMGFRISEFSPLIIMGLFVALIVAMITLVNTNFGLMILVFSMLLSPEIGGKISVTGERGVTLRFEDFLIIAIFFVWLTKITLNKELGFIRRTPLNKPIVAYIFINIFCTAMGVLYGDVKPYLGFFYVLKYVEFFMIYFLFVNNLKDIKQLKTIIFYFLVTSFIIGLYTYSQMGSWDRPTAPFEGAHSEPNTLGIYLMLCLTITLGLFLNLKFSMPRNILAGLFCFNIYPLLMTLSRSAYIGFVASYLSLIVFTRKSKLILAGIFALSILFLPFIAPKMAIDRVLYTFQGKQEVTTPFGFDLKLDKSAASRIEVWSAVLEKITAKPFLGYGVTGLGLIDNQYARILGELGLIGFFVFLYLIFAVLKNVWQIYHLVNDEFSLGLTLGFLCGFIGLLVAGFGANVFVIVRISEPLWFLAACVMVLPEIQEINSTV